MMRSIFATSIWVLAILFATVRTGRAADRPNFVFMFADDQRYDALSCVQKEQGDRGRFPWFQTPNMDRLAAGGVRFRNAFVVNALCSPSRACFMTGQYSHRNGIFNNRTPYAADRVSHVKVLREAGYCTGYVGKWHMGNQEDRPGFDWYASFVGQSRYVDPPYLVNGVKTETKGWTDDLSGDFAVRFLEKERAKDKPFVLVVGFKAPHGPFDPPQRKADTLTGQKARVVPNLGSAPGFNPELGKAITKPTTDLVDVNLNYFRCIAAVDDNVGKILDALERLKLDQNTVVVYSSDNGFYLGEHGLADKRSGYEESIRIPFIVRDPRGGRRGAVNDDMVLNIDLAPTFIDMAGLRVPAEMQGVSWASRVIAKDDIAQKPLRESFLYEYFRENGGKGAAAKNPGGFNTPTMTAVRTSTAKLLVYEGHPEWTEMFDLATDPYETKNLANIPEHRDMRTRLEAEHARLVSQTGYIVPKGVDPKPKNVPPPPPIKSGPVLDYTFAKDDGSEVFDETNCGSSGTAVKAPRVGGRDKRFARKFDGTGYIDVMMSESMKMAGVPFSIAVTVRAEGGDGVLFARGGATNGFAVWLSDGYPTVRFNVDGKATTLKCKERIGADWADLRLEARRSGVVVLSVNGKSVAEGKLPRLISREPNDGMTIGADHGSPVDAEAAKHGFRGLIERVRVERLAD